MRIASKNSVTIFAYHFQQPWLSCLLVTVQNKFFHLLILYYMLGYEDQNYYIKKNYRQLDSV